MYVEIYNLNTDKAFYVCGSTIAPEWTPGKPGIVDQLAYYPSELTSKVILKCVTGVVNQLVDHQAGDQLQVRLFTMDRENTVLTKQAYIHAAFSVKWNAVDEKAYFLPVAAYG